MYNLTTSQQNIWNLQKFYEGTSISNVCGSVLYAEKLERDIFVQAINQMVALQSGLRLQFHEQKGQAVQDITPYMPFSIPYLTFESDAAFQQYAGEYAKQPFDLCDTVMFRPTIFEVNDKTGLLFCASHLVSDAWSMSLIAKQAYYLYQQIYTGDFGDIKEIDFSNIIAAEQTYLTSSRYQKDAAYWAEHYAQNPEPSPIKVHAAQDTSPEANRYIKALSQQQISEISEFCRTSGYTPAVVFEAAMITYLAKINSENQTITIGVPVLNRTGRLAKEAIGMFISTMPLTVEISSEMTFATLCANITTAHYHLFRHQKYPYSEILRSLREKNNFSGNLYDVMVSFQNAKIDVPAHTQWFSNGYSEVPIALHIDSRDETGQYILTLDYQTALFQLQEAEFLSERLLHILHVATENPISLIQNLSILPDAEYQKVIHDFNNTTVEYPKDKCVHTLFEEQAAKTPDKIALIFENKQFTYQQLDEMSNSLAHLLRERGIGRNDIVPIIAKRSWHVIVAMLGILKAGGAYMPVDPTYPRDRITYMIDTAECNIALTFGYKEELPIERVLLDKFNYASYPIPVDNINYSEDYCYIIFTSGSTGNPKGLSTCHKNVVNYCDNNRNNNVCHSIIKANYQSIVSVTNIIFDIFVTESLLPLLNGITIYFANDEQVFSQNHLSKLISENSIDVIQTTHTKMRSYIMDKQNVVYLQKLKAIVLGGEALPAELYRELRVYSNAEIFNIYGPAETTVWSTNKKIKGDEITIGKPIANTQVYILDKHHQPLPIGVAGELCISGDGVGKGYLNRPELTAEKFIPNPFLPGKTMYCTGDLARWRADGEIEYLGRMDTQVKIRGLRIELGEIESVMSSFDGIGLTAVTDKKDETGRQYLVGYYTADSNIDEKALRQQLATKLPKYMVPNYFVHLDKMPMTSSGKTDRKNLPLPEFTALAQEYVAPQTPTEEKLSAIWSGLLKIDNISRTDDFFDLGGDSLMAIALLSKLENIFTVSISIKDILERPVLEQFAAFIDQAQGQQEKFPATGTQRYVLLPQQMAIYAACSKDPQTLAYNMPACLEWSENIDKERLKVCLRQLFELHPELKTSIHSDDGMVYAAFKEDAEITFEEYTEQNRQSFVRPFDLSKAPLVRVGFTETAMLFDMHHIIADGTSLNIILRDLEELYKGRTVQKSEFLYSDYVSYFHSANFTEHKTYFKNMLKCDFEPLSLPEKKHTGKAEGLSLFYQIDKDTFEKGRAIAHANKMTDTMVFLSAFGILLSRYTARTDILSSVVVTNRTHKETQNITGMFVNTLPVMLPVEGTTADYLTYVRNLMLNLYQYQELPFFEIAETAGMSDKNVVNTSFVYQADGAKQVTIGEFQLTPTWIDTHTAKFDLTFELTPNENGCALRIEYNSGKYEEALIDNLFKGYLRIIDQLEKENLKDISVLSDAEYQKVIYDFNDTAVEYPKDKCVHTLFEEQAAKTPDQTAIIACDKTLTYAELNKQANRIAHSLIKMGVGPGDIVAFALPRRSYLIATMFGILKAGAAYMPIDPDYPQDRIDYMLKDSQAKLLISEEKIGDLLKNNCTDNPSIALTSKEPCYCIYTSGTTGKAKGILVTHCNVVNFIQNNDANTFQKCILNCSDYFIAVNSVSFDITLQEIHLPLLNGRSSILFSDEQTYSVGKAVHLLKDKRCGLIITPTKLEIYMTDQSFCDNLKNVTFIMCGAEIFPPQLRKKIQQYTSAVIFNGYGPTETTCGVLYSKTEDGADITIGKPIANTQIYILDKHHQPLPIGVAGELCISGDGVGKGYLNRPELTAEKFIQNPFLPGKTMYCTGDLARWRADGEIEYLGRMDTQVKIRGLRIELGEIESVMNSFDGIGLTAVTDKKDETGRQYLVGYYTADSSIDEKALRQHLLAKLPKYMVPNYFVHLNEIPMTSSGKTDRKNLPLPEFAAQSKEYIAPTTEQEKALCNVLSKLFNMKTVGVSDDFFELGGDSLRAIEYMAKAHNAGIHFSLQNVFDYPTVESLCQYLQTPPQKETVFTADQFQKYEPLLRRNTWDSNFTPSRREIRSVLLTGGTGFLGAHILDTLMKHDVSKIYCLVRGGGEKLAQRLQYYFGKQYDKDIGITIIPIASDLENKNVADDLPEQVDYIIHTAASVKHYGSWQHFKSANVDGTKRIVAYAQKVGARLIHISTISVSGNTGADQMELYISEEEKHFYESSLYIGQPLDNVYVRSKFEAEMLVLDAMQEGLRANIIRVGNLTNRKSNLKFQPNYEENAFLKRVKAILELGCLPDYLMSLYSEFSPVDSTAEAIVRIAEHMNDRYTIFHANSNQNLYFGKMLEYLKQAGWPLEVINGAQFAQRIRNTIDSQQAYIFEALANDLSQDDQLKYDTNIHIENDFTVQYLQRIGFEWPEIDYAYVEGYLRYFTELGYFDNSGNGSEAK